MSPLSSLLQTQISPHLDGGIIYLLFGILAFPAGMLLGWSIWRNCRKNADRLEDANRELREIHDHLLSRQQQIRTMIEEL